jgi:hypothetical protein
MRSISIGAISYEYAFANLWNMTHCATVTYSTVNHRRACRCRMNSRCSPVFRSMPIIWQGQHRPCTPCWGLPSTSLKSYETTFTDDVAPVFWNAEEKYEQGCLMLKWVHKVRSRGCSRALEEVAAGRIISLSTRVKFSTLNLWVLDLRMCRGQKFMRWGSCDEALALKLRFWVSALGRISLSRPFPDQFSRYHTILFTSLLVEIWSCSDLLTIWDDVFWEQREWAGISASHFHLGQRYKRDRLIYDFVQHRSSWPRFRTHITHLVFSFSK